MARTGERIRRGLGALGVTGREAVVDGTRLSYGEGPASGPPLLLVHGQGSRWQDHRRVLPGLVRDHRVYAVDVPGHGRSDRLPAGAYTNAHLADLLAGFVEQVADGPVLVSGHSSGGLLALGLAARHPGLVRGLLLEDPPLFSSVAPRIADTIGGVLPRLATAYLRDRPAHDFQRYFVEHGDYFAFFGPLARPLTRYALRWIDRHPGRALRIGFLPELVNVYFEGMAEYDPAFGTAWDDGAWYRGFDTEEALRSVSAPAVLVHTTWWHDTHGTSYSDGGVLMAAMDTGDAARAARLLGGADTVTVGSGHLVHFERPKEYLAALARLTARLP
ncbi:2-succinyl-6-hydroxy-2,4-cyclohexadiene-1-carboxylate synthase [Nocardiopsis dassonvillei]|uniref:alpha/beta fold hydrolase n=1 Tax=Nocardiopsis dassonvillei TaxID=2014 RepID=UPI003F57160E